MTTTRTEAVNHFIGSGGPPLSGRHSWMTWSASFADYSVRIETDDDETLRDRVQSSRALLLSSSHIGPEQWRVSVGSFSDLPGAPSDRNADVGPLLRFSTCVFLSSSPLTTSSWSIPERLGLSSNPTSFFLIYFDLLNYWIQKKYHDTINRVEKSVWQEGKKRASGLRDLPPTKMAG